MASGVSASDECLQTFNELQLQRKYKYIIFGLADDMRAIEVKEAVPSDPSRSNEDVYAEFLEKLPENDCRYAAYDFEFEKGDGSGIRNKICFFSWTPDSARVKQKMVYASSREALRKSLTGIHIDVQGTDKDEVSYEITFGRADKSR